jgi:anti-sigma factor RsiW
MLNCELLDPLVTPYVDGQLADADRRAVEQHLRACAPCESRVVAERAIRDLIGKRKPALAACCAPDRLHHWCAEAAADAARPAERPRLRAVEPDTHRGNAPAVGAVPPAIRSQGWRSRLAPLAAAASLILVVGTAFLYQLTSSSNRVMAAELAADHLKCFGVLNPVFHTHDDAATVESSMLSAFGWQMRLPDQASRAGLELVGSRPCLYGEGKIAHIMYRHNGEPVSLFMLPRTARTEELVQVMGHQAAIWCAGNRTFVLVAHEPKAEVERMATAVQASLR